MKTIKLFIAILGLASVIAFSGCASAGFYRNDAAGVSWTSAVVSKDGGRVSRGGRDTITISNICPPGYVAEFYDNDCGVQPVWTIESGGRRQHHPSSIGWNHSTLISIRCYRYIGSSKVFCFEWSNQVQSYSTNGVLSLNLTVTSSGVQSTGGYVSQNL